MKTTLVVKDWSGFYARAAMPGEAPSTYHSNLHYVAAHKAMISHGFGPVKPEHQPEAVHIRYSVYRPKGGKLERVRKLPEAVVETLEALDAARDVLQKQLQEISQKEKKLLAEVYAQCAPIKMTDVRGFKNV